MKRTIQLRESELKKMITESIRRALNETRLDKEDNYPRLGCEKSRPGDIHPSDDDIHYPGDINPDVWDALSRGDYGDKNLNESMSFGYTWENAFVDSISALIKKGGESEAVRILSKWFNDEQNSWALYVFLKRSGHEPSSQDLSSIYEALATI